MAQPGAAKPVKWPADRPLYKYLTSDVGRIVLADRTLRWSTPRTLNDPYDMQFDVHVDIDKAAAKALALQKSWDAHYGSEPNIMGNPLGAAIRFFRPYFPRPSREEFDRQVGEALDESFARIDGSLPRLNDEVRAMMASSKILCLTAIPDNTLMWSHYAESHKGVVLRFRSVEGLDSPWTEARPMNYVDAVPPIMDEEFVSDLLSGRRALEPGTIMERVVYTKSGDWAHENEWRIYSGDGRNREAPYEDIPFGALELDGVVFGYRMENVKRDGLVELIRDKYPHAELLQADKSPQAFAMTVVPFAQ